MAAHQAPPSLGSSRQEHWSGLPFPSPMRESEKWKWSRSVVSDSVWPHGLQPTRLLRPWGFPGKSTGVGCHCLLPPALQAGSLPLSHQRSHKTSTQTTKKHSWKKLKTWENGGVYFTHGSEIQHYKDVNFPQTDLHIVDTVSIKSQQSLCGISKVDSKFIRKCKEPKWRIKLENLYY